MPLANGFGLLSSNPGRPLHYRFFKRQRHRVNDIIAKSSRITNDPILDPSQFDWTKAISDHWETIREEALNVCRHSDAIPPLREVSPDHRRIIQDNAWRSFFLIGYGHRIEPNISRAPKTAALVSEIPGINSAFFSILAPGSHIIPHRGVTKAFITAHLGLEVPDDRDNLWMRVADERVHWAPGKWTMFDDTYEHEVRNDTDQHRVILLCQVARPLAQPGALMADLLMAYVRNSPFVREAKDNLTDWEAAFAEAEQEDHN